jgi:iron complex outermembrane receptor protein
VTDDGLVTAQADYSGHFDAQTRFGYRANALAASGDTYVTGVRRDQRVGAFATDFKFTPDLTVYADVDFSRTESKGGGALFPNIGIGTDGRYITNTPDARKNIQPDWSRARADNRLAGLEVNWNVNDAWRLNLLARYVHVNEGGYGGVLFNAPWQPNGDHELTNYGYENRYRTWSSTAFAQGQFATGAVEHRLTVGASYLDSDLDGLFAENNFATTVASNYFTPAVLPFIPAGPWVPGFQIRSRQQGVFVSDEMKIGAWRPLIGARYSKLDYAATFDNLPSSTNKVTPMLALGYDLTPSVALYSSYATGLENGGRAPLGTVNENQQLPPLQTRSVEVGVKSDLLEGAATLDAALFSVRRTAAFVNGANVFVQSGDQVHDGIELSAKGRFWAPLEISAGFTYLDAKLEGDPATDGNRPTNVANFRAVFYGEYRVTALPGLFLIGSAERTGKRETNLPNNVVVPGYSLFGLGARYDTRLAGQRLVLRANLDNLTDRRYWAKVGEFDALPGAPRTARVSAELAF